MTKKLLIISREQFGYNTDRYKWCEYLRNKYDITYFSIASREKYDLQGVKLLYLNGNHPRVVRIVLFMTIVSLIMLYFNGIIIINYFPHCEMLQRLFPHKKIICDFRTMSVLEDSRAREKDNCHRRRAASVFKHVTAISDGVAKQLNVNNKIIGIIPLGADIINTKNKRFDIFRLLYVGTLYNRNIERTIEGFAKAKKILPKHFTMTYDIIGSGPNGEQEKLERLISSLGLNDYVSCHGYIQHNQLKTFFEECNIGVSFVPQRSFYEHQPVTKTFEYALAGLYVIATDTISNREVVTPQNGILIQDTKDSFADGIVSIYNNWESIKSSDIRQSLAEYAWPKIVKGKLEPILEVI